MRGLLLMVFLVASVSAQEVQIKRVYDFSGGLMNSISNAAMRDNMAAVLENYDIDPFGNLRRRHGLTSYITSKDSIGYTYAIIPRVTTEGKELFILARSNVASWAGTYSRKITEVFECGVTACDTTLVKGLYYPSTDWNVPYNYDVVNHADQLLLASTNSELTVYDGDNFYPARPRAPGQANVSVWNGDGNIKGTVRYKYCYIDTTLNDTSNLSPPTWAITANYGRVLIWDIWEPIDTTEQDLIAIYREKNFSGHYEHLVTFPQKDSTYYWDNTAETTPADTFKYPWGPMWHCSASNDVANNTCTTGCADELFGAKYPDLDCPASVTVGLTGGGYGIGHGAPDNLAGGKNKCWFIAWSVVFVDTAGRHSYMSAPNCKPCGCSKIDTNIYATITNIPVPHDSGIVKKLLIRMHADDQGLGHEDRDSGWVNIYFVVDTLHPDSTTYTDTVGYSEIRERDPYLNFCVGRPWPPVGSPPGWIEYDSVGEIPELVCYDDSVISFRPSSIALHGGRLYGVGDPNNNNRLYYSSFDRITTWPCSQYIFVPSSGTDWFVDLLPLEDRLILFRQNSIVQLQGHSFYQFSLDQLIDNVGLTAPRSVVRIGNTVYFYHSTGVYTLSAFGGVSPQPLSFAIQRSLDSFMVNQQRAVGAGIAGDYWLSIDYASTNQRTYIYSETPIPHWKTYGFGLHAVVQHDPDSTYGNFNPNKWLIALVRRIGYGSGDQTILYQWQEDALSGFLRTDTVDTWSDTTSGAIIATYQSKRFFEGRERERVYWIDLVGEGDADTITFTFLDEGVAFDTVKYLPDFTDGIRDRIIVDHIVSDFAVRWQDNGYGQYTIKGYEIGWIPWDRGRPVP